MDKIELLKQAIETGSEVVVISGRDVPTEIYKNPDGKPFVRMSNGEFYSVEAYEFDVYMADTPTSAVAGTGDGWTYYAPTAILSNLYRRRKHNGGGKEQYHDGKSWCDLIHDEVSVAEGLRKNYLILDPIQTESGDPAPAKAEAGEIDQLGNVLTLADRARKATNLYEANADLATAIILVVAELRKGA